MRNFCMPSPHPKDYWKRRKESGGKKSPGVKQASKGLSMSMHCCCLKWRIDGGEFIKAAAK
jgi:hypothetical protein